MSIIADDGWFTSWHRNYSEIDSIVITPHCCTSLYVVMLFESKIHMVADVVLIQHGNYECTLCTYLSQVQRMLFWFPRQFVMEQLYRVAGWWLVVYTTAISTQSISYTHVICDAITGLRARDAVCLRVYVAHLAHQNVFFFLLFLRRTFSNLRVITSIRGDSFLSL